MAAVALVALRSLSSGALHCRRWWWPGTRDLVDDGDDVGLVGRIFGRLFGVDDVHLSAVV